MNTVASMLTDRPPLFPLFADLRGRRVLVVGGGAIAARKVSALLEAGAAVTVVAPTLDATLVDLVALGRIQRAARGFEPADVDGALLVVAASDAVTVNHAVVAAAAARGIFVNVVDDAAHSSVHVPARLRRGLLQIAISTAGAAPVLARQLRARLEAEFDGSLAALVALFARERARIRWRFPQPGKRQRFVARVLTGDVPRLLQMGDIAGANLAFERALVAGEFAARRGGVTLVGAGPGDAGLLTLNALRALQAADAILYDRLVSLEVLDLARRDAVRIAVGKRVGEDHAATQTRIHALMLHHAQAGRHVVRLHGGDPLVFGRGGEELDFLRGHGIPVRVVPGITAALGCAAAAGIALTDRRCAHGVTLASARDAEQWNAKSLPADRTLVIYMGVGEIDALTRALLRHGRDGATPCAVIENGTRADQHVLRTTLNALPELAVRHALQPPALLIIGEVAAQARRVLRAERCHDRLMRVTTRAA